MKNTDYKKEYIDLKEKYVDLPAYDTFNHYMEISFISYDIFDSNLMARYFRRLCERRLESFIGFLQNLIHPPQQMIVLMEESQSLSEAQKEEATTILKRAMAMYRTCSLLNYNFNEVEECKKIVAIVGFLQETQPFLDKLIAHLKAEWEKIAESKKHSSNYVG